MLSRLTICLPEEVRAGLETLAKREERGVKMQAVRLLREALEREGVLPSPEPQAQREEKPT